MNQPPLKLLDFYNTEKEWQEAIRTAQANLKNCLRATRVLLTAIEHLESVVGQGPEAIVEAVNEVERLATAAWLTVDNTSYVELRSIKEMSTRMYNELLLVLHGDGKDESDE